MSIYAYMPYNDEEKKAPLHLLGIPASNIYADTVDIRNSQAAEQGNGPAYRKLLKELNKGDTLYIQSFDVLGFNMRDILNQWRKLTKDRGVDVVVMNSPLLDTRLAKERGVHCGRVAKPLPENFESVYGSGKMERLQGRKPRKNAICLCQRFATARPGFEG